MQQRAASEVPDDESLGLGLVRRLVRRPIWLAGTAGDTLGYVAQAAALGLGSLVLVQPLLATSLLFALPLGAWWAGRRLRRSDGLWALALTAGLAVFLVAGEPT
jgi:drug/metabolite transporter (DMT)-like permease